MLAGLFAKICPNPLPAAMFHRLKLEILSAPVVIPGSDYYKINKIGGAIATTAPPKMVVDGLLAGNKELSAQAGELAGTLGSITNNTIVENAYDSGKLLEMGAAVAAAA